MPKKAPADKAARPEKEDAGKEKRKKEKKGGAAKEGKKAAIKALQGRVAQLEKEVGALAVAFEEALRGTRA